jgi:uncharacterized protein YndB with AHSA1/START domain
VSGVKTVRVERSIPASPEAIFELISGHANYSRFRGIHGSELLREGRPPPNGLGAMRRVVVRPVRFEEEITAFDPPSRMDYVIKKINVPLEHEVGSIRLSPEDGATRVEWTSTFRVPTPLVGGVQERIWALALGRGFRRVLEDVERMLAKP